MKTTTKLAWLACAAATIAVPVSANHNGAGLRGMFAGGNATAGVYASEPCNTCYDVTSASSDWRHARLTSQYAAPTRVGHYGGQSGLRGLSQAGYAPVHTTGHATTLSQMHTHAEPIQLSHLSYLNDPYSGERFYNASASRSDALINLGGATVRTSVANSDRMLDWDENTTGKALTLLAHRQNGVLAPNALYIGGGFKGGFMYQKTEVDGQFPILSRFPFFSNRTDDEAGVFAINNAALSFTSTFGDWTTMFLQTEYSETEYGRDQDEFQLRKAYVVFGNLDRSPFYAAFGRKTVDFGNFDSYNAFTHNEGAHYFWTVSDQPVAELGFYKNGWKMVATAMSGGRQLRVANAGEDNNIGNYAFSAEKEFLFRNGGAFTVGGGYLHDTIYRDNSTAHTFQALAASNVTIEYRNSAVNAFAEYNSPFFDAMVEYTTTLEPWAGAIPQSPDGVINPAYIGGQGELLFDQNLEVLVAQARIKPMIGGRRLAIAAVGSWGNIGDDFVGTGTFGQPTTWEKNQQHALSLEYPVNDFLDVGAEYVYNKGFIPFVAPQLVSNDQTEAHAINVGFKARF